MITKIIKAKYGNNIVSLPKALPNTHFHNYVVEPLTHRMAITTLSHVLSPTVCLAFSGCGLGKSDASCMAYGGVGGLGVSKF